MNYLDKMTFSKIKLLYNLNLKETIKLLEEIDYNNAEIENTKIIYKFNDYPFIEHKEKLSFNENSKKLFYDGVINLENVDGVTPIISLISIYDQLSNKNFSLLSLQILPTLEIGDVYINYNLLRTLNFNELSQAKLTKEEIVSSITKTLSTIKDGFLTNRGQHSLMFAKDFELMNIENKIFKLREILQVSISNHYELLNQFIVFTSIDLDLNKYTKKDYLILQQNPNLINFSLLKYYNKDMYSELLEDKTLFLSEKSEIFNNLTLSQGLAVKNATSKLFGNINGIPGSGKTHISIQIIVYNLFLSLIARVKFDTNFSFLFTTYNKKALFDFKSRFVEYGLQNLLFINDNLDSSFSNVLDNIDHKLKLGTNPSVLEKLNKIEEKVEKSINAINALEKYFENKKLEEEILNLLSMKSPDKSLKKLEMILNGSVDDSLLEEFKDFIMSFFNQEQEMIFIPKDIISDVRSVIKLGNSDTLKGINITKQQAKKILLNFQKFKKKSKIIKKKNSISLTKDINSYIDNINTINEIEKELSNFTLEEIVFYMENFYLKKQTDYYKKLVKYLKLNNQNDVIEKNNLLKLLGDKKNLINRIFDIFPINLSLISKLGNAYPLQTLFDFTVVDEAYQTPGYFLITLLHRTRNVLSIGDSSQIINNNLYNKKTQSNLFKEIYDTDSESQKKRKNTAGVPEISIEELFEFYENYGTSKLENNIYNIFSRINPSFENILIDNFRSHRNIVNATLFTSFKYQSIVKLFIEKNKDNIKDNELKSFLIKELQNWNDKSLYKIVNVHQNKDNIFETLEGNEIKGNLFFANTTINNKCDENTIEKTIFNILEFCEVQKDRFRGKELTGNDILYITPFKHDANKINSMFIDLRNKYPIVNGILCDSVENIQGIERKIVIFDSGIINSQSEQQDYIVENPEILTVAISRAKNLFVFMGNISYINENMTQNLVFDLLKEQELFKFHSIK